MYTGDITITCRRRILDNVQWTIVIIACKMSDFEITFVVLFIVDQQVGQSGNGEVRQPRLEWLHVTL